MFGVDDDDKPPIDWDTVRNIKSSVQTKTIFNPEQCKKIEDKIDELVAAGEKGVFKHCTVDRAPLRNKYFFGEGYTYGAQLQQNPADKDKPKAKGPGNEKLYPEGEVDPIPTWITDLVIKPIEDAGIIPKDWINSAVINDYRPGGCIVSHIDPPQLFDRPIITASFLSDSALSFGCKFTFKPLRASTPIVQVPVWRGCVLSMSGFAADEITHCIRPDDTEERRAVVILRHVPDSAPRMTIEELAELRKAEELKKMRYDPGRWRRRSRSPRPRWKQSFHSQRRRSSRSRSKGRRSARSRSSSLDQRRSQGQGRPPVHSEVHKVSDPNFHKKDKQRSSSTDRSGRKEKSKLTKSPREGRFQLASPYSSPSPEPARKHFRIVRMSNKNSKSDGKQQSDSSTSKRRSRSHSNRRRSRSRSRSEPPPNRRKKSRSASPPKKISKASPKRKRKQSRSISPPSVKRRSRSKSKGRARKARSSSSSSSSSEDERQSKKRNSKRKKSESEEMKTTEKKRKRSSGTLEDGEISSHSASPSPAPKRPVSLAQLEEQSIETRLKNLDKKREKKPKRQSASELDDLDLEKEIEDLEKRSKDSLRNEVVELRKELDDLKELVKDISAKDNKAEAKTINALDIIAREVRTKILKNEEKTTTETILKLKVERKKKQLKARLNQLKGNGEAGDEVDETEAHVAEFKKQKKTKEYRKKDNSEEEMDQGKGLLEALRKRLEKRRAEGKKQTRDESPSPRRRRKSERDRSRSRSRDRAKEKKSRKSEKKDREGGEKRRKSSLTELIRKKVEK